MICRIIFCGSRERVSQSLGPHIGYFSKESNDVADACASFEVKSRGVCGEMFVTSNSVSLSSTVAVFGRLWSQIMSRTSFGSSEKNLKVDMMVVILIAL